MRSYLGIPVRDLHYVVNFQGLCRVAMCVDEHLLLDKDMALSEHEVVPKPSESKFSVARILDVVVLENLSFKLLNHLFCESQYRTGPL